jgi:hypothetical protein
MSEPKSVVRQELEKIDGVHRTKIEWTLNRAERVKTLVIEVDFDTDPSSPGFREDVLDKILSVATSVLESSSTLLINRLHVIPKSY